MRKAFLWLFSVRDPADRREHVLKASAQLVILMLPLFASALIWRWSNGLAACVLMIGIILVGFLFTTWYRWNVLPPPQPDQARDETRRDRRRARTDFWRRRILWLAEHDQGKQGDLARSIKKRWDEVEGSANDKPDS